MSRALLPWLLPLALVTSVVILSLSGPVMVIVAGVLIGWVAIPYGAAWLHRHSL